jgi:uncharacterized ion transporter superfamily protein YfcC
VRGLYATVDVAGFLFCIGGFLAVVNVSGAIDSGIARVVARLRGREIWMIPILMTLFSLGGTSWGACPKDDPHPHDALLAGRHLLGCVPQPGARS